jgi:hypothetical protein
MLQCAAAHADVSAETPSEQVALVLSALAEGLDVSAGERVFGFRHATITR